jgi:hypothetical protein
VEEALRSNRLIHLWFPAMIYKRETAQKVGGFKIMPTCTDIDMINRLAEVGPLLAQPEYLVKYRVHSGSISYGKHNIQLKETRRIRACMIARRANQPVPSDDEYFSIERRLPLFSRMVISVRDTAAVCYKKAVVALANEQTVRAFYYGMLSLLIWPPYLVRKVIRRRLVPDGAASTAE